MAHHSIEKNWVKENGFYTQGDRLVEQMAKARALAEVSLSDDFHEFSQLTQHHYLWTLCDLLAEMQAQLDNFW